MLVIPSESGKEFMNEGTAVVGLGNVGAEFQLIFLDQLGERAAEVTLEIFVLGLVEKTSVRNDPGASLLVVDHRDTVVVVVGVRRSVFDEDVSDRSRHLGCSESREETEIQQNVREFCTHLAPP